MDNMQEFLDNQVKALKDQIRAYSGSDQMSLGMLAEELKAYATRTTYDDKPLKVTFDFCDAFPKRLMSWRGSYDEICFDYAFWDSDNEPLTVREVLQKVQDAIGETFTGYKGGEFRMTTDTPVWVSKYSESCKTAVIGVIDDGWRIVLATALRDA